MMRVSKAQVVMVDDKVTTGVKGAKDAGMRVVLSRTGEFNERELESMVAPD